MGATGHSWVVLAVALHEVGDVVGMINLLQTS
jgi:hypothetical protein